MEIQRAKAIIEAILFAMGSSVELESLAYAIDQDQQTTQRIIHSLMDEYDGRECGLTIIELEDRFQMCTKREYYEYLIKVAARPKKHVLTDVMMETLSIIAYKQPVTRLEVEKIRGVKSDHAINKLIEYGLIEEKGRLNAPGRPIAFGTTEEFLRHFGLSSLENLPEGAPELEEEIREELEEEMQLTLQFIEEPEKKLVIVSPEDAKTGEGVTQDEGEAAETERAHGDGEAAETESAPVDDEAKETESVHGDGEAVVTESVQGVGEAAVTERVQGVGEAAATEDS